MLTCPYCEAALQRVHAAPDSAAFVPCLSCGNILQIRSRERGWTASTLPNTLDVRDECPPGSVGGIVLQWLSNPRQRLVPIPEMESYLATKDASSDEGLTLAVEADPALALSVMGAANSDVFSGLEATDSVPGALDRLGIDTVREQVARGRVEKPQPVQPVESLARIRLETWRNAVFTAHCAEAIARLGSGAHTGRFYTAGLVHDVGRFAVCDALAASDDPTMQNILRSDDLIYETIDRFHGLCGLHMVYACHLPAFLGAVTLFHDAPEEAHAESSLFLLHAVNFAEVLGRATGYGRAPEFERMLLAHPSNRVLGLSNVQIAALRIDVSDTVKPIMEALGIPPVPPIA